MIARTLVNRPKSEVMKVISLVDSGRSGERSIRARSITNRHFKTTRKCFGMRSNSSRCMEIQALVCSLLCAV